MMKIHVETPWHRIEEYPDAARRFALIDKREGGQTLWYPTLQGAQTAMDKAHRRGMRERLAKRRHYVSKHGEA